MVGISSHALFGAVMLLQSVNGAVIQASTSTSPSSTPLPASTSLPAAVKCPSSSSFKSINAKEFVAKMNPGWNLGNTLDAVETEGSWNNPPVVGGTFDDVKKAGFKGVRLPVTWTYHFTSEGPEWAVDGVWLQRVSDVLDMITSRGLYALVNVHHDSWTWADVTLPGANVTQIEERFYRLWYQIGTKLACKGSMVGFEPINEPVGSTEEHGEVQNRLNTIFLQAINDAGGFNPKRVVTLAGVGNDALKTSLWFERPDEKKFKNPWALQYHYYSPYDFIFSAWGKTTWGSDADKAALENDIALISSNFTDVPLIIGEWAASPVATETAARWRYFDFFLRTAVKYNTATILWDNGADFLNRATHAWRDPVALDIYRHVVKGDKNALPESTTDGSATTQESSAYIYHEKGANVTDVTLPFQFNGNTLKSASVKPKKLASGKDYVVDTAKQTITFKASFLTSKNVGLTPTTAPGTLTNITLAFDKGADLTVNVLQWATPTLSSSSTPLPATSADLHIPVTWAGQNRPAAIKATKSDGTFLVDDWTQYLGPLQQGRLTYNNHFDWDASGVILKAAVLEEVRKAGKTTVFRIEFYPRREGNWVEFTVTV